MGYPGSNALGGPPGPYRYVPGTPRPVPGTRHRTVPSWSGPRPYGNRALGSMGPILSGSGQPEQRSCSSVLVSSAVLAR